MTGLILWPERDAYVIAESIRPRLRIVNGEGVPLVLSGLTFDWERLAFARPSEVHLHHPPGDNLLRPYEVQPKSNELSTITVGPGREEWIYLPISNHVHLRELTEYVFWLELADAANNVSVTNKISFRLRDVRSPFAAGTARLSLERTGRSVSNPKHVELTAVFTNSFNRPLRFLLPQDDSTDGWVNPIYQFTVIDARGRTLALARRSGSMATPHYDAASRIVVEPGENGRITVSLPSFPGVEQGGRYSVRLTYIVRDEAIGKGGIGLGKPIDWPDGTFVGRLESNDVDLVIE